MRWEEIRLSLLDGPAVRGMSESEALLWAKLIVLAESLSPGEGVVKLSDSSVAKRLGVGVDFWQRAREHLLRVGLVEAVENGAIAIAQLETTRVEKKKRQSKPKGASLEALVGQMDHPDVFRRLLSWYRDKCKAANSSAGDSVSAAQAWLGGLDKTPELHDEFRRGCSLFFKGGRTHGIPHLCRFLEGNKTDHPTPYWKEAIEQEDAPSEGGEFIPAQQQAEADVQEWYELARKHGKVKGRRGQGEEMEVQESCGDWMKPSDLVQQGWTLSLLRNRDKTTCGQK